MAIKTFTTGEVLTASDTNTYLANSGLVYIKQQTVGNGVASVTVSSAFSTDYDSYVIVDTGGSMSVDTALKMTLGSTATGYYYFLTYGQPSAATVLGDNGSNLTAFNHAGGGATRSCYIEIQSPFLARATEMRSRVRYGTVYGQEIGLLADSTSYTSFTFTPSSGTLTGGTIYVYGYRKA